MTKKEIEDKQEFQGYLKGQDILLKKYEILKEEAIDKARDESMNECKKMTRSKYFKKGCEDGVWDAETD